MKNVSKSDMSFTKYHTVVFCPYGQIYLKGGDPQ